MITLKKKIFIISLFVFLVDQIIKALATKYLTYRSLIPGILSLIYAKNEGVAFSMFWGNRWFIIILSVLLMAILLWILNKDYLKEKKESKLKNFTFGILIGGIFGNLFDRVLRGYVIDYVALNIFGYSFPIFNLADVFITIGVILMAVSLKDD